MLRINKTAILLNYLKNKERIQNKRNIKSIRIPRNATPNQEVNTFLTKFILKSTASCGHNSAQQ